GYEKFGEPSFKAYRVELVKPAILRGRAVDSDGQPLKGVKVRVSSPMAIDGRGYGSPGGAEAATDGAGRFELTGLPTGFTQPRTDRPEYYFGDLFTRHDVPGEDVTLRLVRAAKVRVAVLDKNGQPLARFKDAPIMVSVEPRGGLKIGTWGGSGNVNDEGT